MDVPTLGMLLDLFWWMRENPRDHKKRPWWDI